MDGCQPTPGLSTCLGGEGSPRSRPDDPVDLQPLGLLEQPDRLLRPRTEHTVNRQTAEQVAKLDAALVSPDISARAIAVVLAGWGHEVKEGTISKWRKFRLGRYAR